MVDKTPGTDTSVFNMAKTDVIPDCSGPRVAEMTDFAENPVAVVPPRLLQPLPAAHAQEGDRAAGSHLHPGVPKVVLQWETSQCFSRANKSTCRSTYLGQKAAPAARSGPCRAANVPFLPPHAEDGRRQLCAIDT